MSIHMSIHVSIHISIHMSIHMSTHMSIHLSIHMSIHMSMDMSMHTSIDMGILQYTHVYTTWYSNEKDPFLQVQTPAREMEKTPFPQTCDLWLTRVWSCRNGFSWDGVDRVRKYLRVAPNMAPMSCRFNSLPHALKH